MQSKCTVESLTISNVGKTCPEKLCTFRVNSEEPNASFFCPLCGAEKQNYLRNYTLNVVISNLNACESLTIADDVLRQIVSLETLEFIYDNKNELADVESRIHEELAGGSFMFKFISMIDASSKNTFKLFVVDVSTIDEAAGGEKLARDDDTGAGEGSVAKRPRIEAADFDGGDSKCGGTMSFSRFDSKPNYDDMFSASPP